MDFWRKFEFPNLSLGFFSSCLQLSNFLEFLHENLSYIFLDRQLAWIWRDGCGSAGKPRPTRTCVFSKRWVRKVLALDNRTAAAAVTNARNRERKYMYYIKARRPDISCLLSLNYNIKLKCTKQLYAPPEMWLWHAGVATQPSSQPASQKTRKPTNNLTLSAFITTANKISIHKHVNATPENR